jgi:DNA-binding GntR family transcriptional regulator
MVASGPRLDRKAPRFRVLSEHVAQALREAIGDGTLRPGARVVEQHIAEALGVSRAPVRDALRLLVRDGLVTLTPHRGAIVTPISADLIADVFDVRVALEGLAARLAAERISSRDLTELRALQRGMEEAAAAGDRHRLIALDVGFHQAVIAASGRPVLMATLEVINARRMLLINTGGYLVPLESVPPRHTPAREALKHRDPARAEAAARAHIEFGKRVLLESSAADVERVAAADPSEPASGTDSL